MVRKLQLQFVYNKQRNLKLILRKTKQINADFRSNSTGSCDYVQTPFHLDLNDQIYQQVNITSVRPNIKVFSLILNYFLKHCTLTNKTVGNIWQALSKPSQRRARFKKGGSQLVIFGCHLIQFTYLLFITYTVRVLLFMTSPRDLAVGLLSI